MTSRQVNIDFITTENIEMIWEIVLDDIKSRLKSQEQFAQARGFFINQARLFFEREKNVPQNLMEMNKKFISLIVNNFNSQRQTPQQPPTKQLFKAEDIQAERLNAFEKGLAEKKNDFMSAMSVPVPEAPKFSDSSRDEPIGGAMGELIARTLAQRNFDVETIHKTANKEEVEKWLKPAETSVKVEKVHQNQQSATQLEEKQKQYQYNQPAPKFIQIGEELPVAPSNKKKISWGENQEYEVNEISLEINEISRETPNIFSRLKQIKEENPETVELKKEIKNMGEKIVNLEDKMNKILELLKNKIEPVANNYMENTYKEQWL
jgi:DNA-binding ferritin-like protein